MKRAIAFILVMTLCLTPWVQAAASVIPEDQKFLTYEELANQPATESINPEAPSKSPCFAIGSVSGQPGDVITVPVTVYNNPGIVGAQVGVSYNKDALTLAAMEGKDFAGVEFGPLDADVASMIWLDAINPNNTNNGVLANLTFVINDNAAAGEYALDLVCVDANNIFNADLQSVTFEFIDGVVTVEEKVVVPTYIPGDVDDNGVVNVRDLGRLQQYLNGYDVVINQYAANVDGNESVNVRDLGRLQQYLNGYDVELKPSTPAEPEQPESILTEEERAFYQSIVDSENAWLASTQLSNGALPMTPTRNGVVQMNPYFADFAALSLLNQPELYADVVKNYMEWHFDHLNTAAEDPSGVDGTIFDYNYTVKNGVVTKEEWTTPIPSYDSTDSYAATFLMVVEKYARQTGDIAYVLSHAQDIHRVLNSLFATMDNGLTYGQPKSKVKMLMDNCEVYAGLQAAVALYRDLLIPAGKSTVAQGDFLQQSVNELVVAMEKDLWIGRYYAPAIYLDGSLYTPFSWDKYYPSAASQTFPIFHGVLDPDSDRAKMLYNEYCTRYDWEHHRHPDHYMWSSNAYTAAVMGDYERVHTFLSVYNERVSASRGHPLYNADAAWACMTAYYMTQL